MPWNYRDTLFGGPAQVLEYLGRYTHRVAIANQRLLSLDHAAVTLQWKDDRPPECPKQMRLATDEFIAVACAAGGLQRIRHFGWLANRNRKAKQQLCRQLLSTPVTTLLPSPQACRQVLEALQNGTSSRCPQCGRGQMLRVETLPAYRWPAQPPDTS
jgi:hypothetical protein